MLRPVIMLGCGGSGQKAVRYVRDAVRRHLEHSGWDEGIPRSWQFLAFDTVDSQEAPGEIPTIPAKDYTSIALQFTTYQELDGALMAKFPPNSAGYREMIGWRANPRHINVPLTMGAGAIRAVGRAAGVLSLQNVVRPKIQHAFTECGSGFPELQRLSQHLGVEVQDGGNNMDPIVVVLGSMAGGTGAGIMLDMIDLVRRTDSKGQFPIAVVFSSDIFGPLNSSGKAANGMAFMSELMSAYWDDEASGRELIPTSVPVSTRGPHAVYLIGRKNMDGIDLSNSTNVYRAVGEALCGWVTSTQVQDEIFTFAITNWDQKARENSGGYPFSKLSQPGVVSSFGSSTISIGRDRFREYTEKLLMRETLEFLDRGHLKRKVDLFGPAAEDMTPDAVRSQLVKKEKENFLRDCQIAERGSVDNQITQIFLSEEIAKEERKQIREDILRQIGDGRSASQWKGALQSQFELARRESTERAARESQKRVADWGNATFERILRMSSEYSAKFGLIVTADLLRAAQTELHEVAIEVRQEGKEAQGKARVRQDEFGRSLPESKGVLQLVSDVVQNATNLLTGSIINDWKYETCQRVAKAMTDLADQVISPIAMAMQQASQKVSHMVTAHPGEQALIESWPTEQNGVPNSFAPSPVEFFLEEHTTWPNRLKELLSKSLPESDVSRGMPSSPIQKARYCLIADEFAGEEIRSRFRPLVWTDNEFGGKPQWAPGNSVQINISLDEENLQSRARAWMRRPGTALQTFMQEGLLDYLNEKDSVNQPVPDHYDRIAKFKQKLSEAINQSKPLIELDLALMSRLHDHGIHSKPIIQGFPFSDGHPARKIVEDVLTPILPTGSDLKGYFSKKDTESVLISSMMTHPVHPMVVKSFVQPANHALSAITADPDMVRGTFWQWARTKVLEDAIPLPDEVRRSMIRGFVVGRLLGFITADPSTPIVISGDDGVEHRFPERLLTVTSAENLLPALLESFVLCFGNVSTRGERAFDAYSQLYTLGEKIGQKFSVRNELLKFVQEGHVSDKRVVDQDRSKAMMDGDKNVRIQKLTNLLESNIERYVDLKKYTFTGQEYRSVGGELEIELTMSLELLEDLHNGYEDVLGAINLMAVTGGTGSV